MSENNPPEHGADQPPVDASGAPTDRTRRFQPPVEPPTGAPQQPAYPQQSGQPQAPQYPGQPQGAQQYKSWR